MLFLLLLLFLEWSTVDDSLVLSGLTRRRQSSRFLGSMLRRGDIAGREMQLCSGSGPSTLANTGRTATPPYGRSTSAVPSMVWKTSRKSKICKRKIVECTRCIQAGLEDVDALWRELNPTQPVPLPHTLTVSNSLECYAKELAQVHI